MGRDEQRWKQIHSSHPHHKGEQQTMKLVKVSWKTVKIRKHKTYSSPLRRAKPYLLRCGFYITLIWFSLLHYFNYLLRLPFKAALICLMKTVSNCWIFVPHWTAQIILKSKDSFPYHYLSGCVLHSDVR